MRIKLLITFLFLSSICFGQTRPKWLKGYYRIDTLYLYNNVVKTNSGDSLATRAYARSLIVAETYGTGWNGSSQAPTKNDVYDKIESLVLYQSVEATTTDATNTTVVTVSPMSGENVRLYAICNAVLSDGNATFNAVKSRTAIRNASAALTLGSLKTAESDEYLGSGLSTATFTITNSGTDVIVQVTGEAAKTIKWKITYLVTRKDAGL